MTDVRFQPASDQSLLVYFGQHITVEAHLHVMQLLRLLESDPIAGIRNLHPAYCSLLIKFDALKLGHDDLEAILRPYLDRLEAVCLPEPRQIEIPVCYGGEHGPDLDEVAETFGGFRWGDGERGRFARRYSDAVWRSLPIGATKLTAACVRASFRMQ